MQETQEMQVQSLGQKDPLEKGMATRSGILAWRIPWTEEPGGLQSMGPQRVGHNWETEHIILGEKLPVAGEYFRISHWTSMLNPYSHSANTQSHIWMDI